MPYVPWERGGDGGMPMFVGVAKKSNQQLWAHSCTLVLNPLDAVPGSAPCQHTTHSYVGDVRQ